MHLSLCLEHKYITYAVECWVIIINEIKCACVWGWERWKKETSPKKTNLDRSRCRCNLIILFLEVRRWWWCGARVCGFKKCCCWHYETLDGDWLRLSWKGRYWDIEEKCVVCVGMHITLNTVHVDLVIQEYLEGNSIQ